ncbi:putative carboxylesterase [Trifolium repens]|nr:putative carboxylesterase [Trifolium repens]
MAQDKKLAVEVSGWLRVYDDGSVDRTWTGPPEIKFMIESVAPHEQFIEGVATRDVRTSMTTTNDGSIHCARLYLSEKIPQGQYKTAHTHALPWWRFLHHRTRFVHHRLPAAIDDGFAAFKWLQSVTRGDAHDTWLEEYGDFDKVFIIGDSSGGNLIHEVAARAGSADLSPIRLAGAIPIHPGFVRSIRSRSEIEMPQSPFLTLEMVDKFFSLALPIGSSKDHPFTCPMVAPPIDGLKLPPFLLCVAEKDLMRDTEMEYYEAMKKANKEVDLFVSKGMTHCFYLNKIAVDLDSTVRSQMDALIGRMGG